jgi:antitoxin MazE
MQARVQKWGNSLAVRIPKSFALEAHLEQDTPVEVSLRDGELIITPIKPGYTLEALLAQVTEQNIHVEQEIGPSIGREEW